MGINPGAMGMLGGAVGFGASVATLALLDKARHPHESVRMDPIEAPGMPDGLTEVRVVERHDDGSITVDPHTGVGSANGYGYTYPIEDGPNVRIAHWKGPAEDDDFRLRGRAMDDRFGVDELERDVPIADRLRARNLAVAIGGGAALAGGAALGFAALAKGHALAPAAKSFGAGLLGVPAAIAGVTLLGFVFQSTTAPFKELAGAFNPVPGE